MIRAMQFSEWLNRAEQCEEWFSWFKQRNIPAAIVEYAGKFAVFRQGKVGRKTDKGLKYIDAPVTLPLNRGAKIISLCNGFSESGMEI